MIPYVEANFILEYVFDQEEGTLVEQIVAHAERGGLTSSEVRTELDSRRCVILTNFERAAHFVLSQMLTKPGAAASTLGAIGSVRSSPAS